MSLKDTEKKLLKEALEKRMKQQNYAKHNTKKGRAQAVLNEPTNVRDIIYELEEENKAPTTPDDQKKIKAYLKLIEKGYFPREKM
jgi:hypothetical protein